MAIPFVPGTDTQFQFRLAIVAEILGRLLNKIHVLLTYLRHTVVELTRLLTLVAFFA
jgi:hypothetical protein